jgi:hypothetical protein
MGRGVHGSGLRTRLLVGVATVALAAPASRWAQAQEAKWSPYIEAGGMGGNTHSWGDVDIFIPLWQDQTSLLFGDLRGTFSTEPSQEGNFGLGYRTQVSPEWILGGYGYFDIQNSENDNLFYQITLGAELKSVEWDFRLNGYIPINPDGGTVKDNVGVKISGNNIQMQTNSTKEKALYGFDGEVGWRVPVFPADGDMDIRLYAGGYYFVNSDVDTIAGPRGRIEARLYDIDFLGMQSRLTAQGIVQWDSPRGVQGFGGLELRIPLGAITGAPGPKLNPLDRRMVDRVQRDVDIVTEEFDTDKKNEDVIVDELTVSTHTIVFANSGGAGNGTKKSPIDLNAAPTLAPGLNGGTGSNAIILADGAAGNIGVTNPLQLLNGQALIGGGSTVLLTGAKTGEHVNFHFPGERPTLTGNGNTKNLVQMNPGGQNEIFGLNFTGSFYKAIFGLNMERAIVKRSFVSGGTGDAAVYLDQSGGGAQASSFVHIAYNSITGAFDAIEVRNENITDGTRTQTVVINENTLIDNGGAGIATHIDVTSAGTVFSQSLLIDNNFVTGNGGNGIEIFNDARTSASIVQSVVIDPNTVIQNGKNGILVGNYATSNGTIFQSVVIAGNTASDNGYNGIAVLNQALFNGAISQVALLSGNVANSNGSNGVYALNRASSIGTVNQTIAIADSTISYNTRNGLLAANRGTGTGAVILQTVMASNVVVQGNGFAGLAFDNQFNNGTTGGASLSQAIIVDPSIISRNAAGGIVIAGDFYNGNFTQNVAITDNLITSNGLAGILVRNTVNNGLTGGVANFTQILSIERNTVAYNHGLLTATSTTVSFGGVTLPGIDTTGGGIDIALVANNLATNGTVNLHSAIDISNNLLARNVVAYGGTSVALSFDLNLAVVQSGFNGAGGGTVNLIGNTLNLANNSFVGGAFDAVIQTNAVNGTGNNSFAGGVVNLQNNVTTIQGNSFDGAVFVQDFGVNGTGSSGITGGLVNLQGNVTTIQGNSFGGGLLLENLAVNGTGSSGVTGGLVNLQNNFTTIQGNSVDSTLLIGNLGVNGTDHSGVTGGAINMLHNTLTLDGNTVFGSAAITNVVLNGADSATVTGGLLDMSFNQTTIASNALYGGVFIINEAANGIDGVVTGGTLNMSNNVTTVQTNTFSNGPVFLANIGSNAAATGGIVTLSANTAVVEANTFSNGGLFLLNIVDNDAATGGIVTLNGNAAIIHANTFSNASLIVFNSGANEAQTGGLVAVTSNTTLIQGNSLTGEAGGIFVENTGSNSGAGGGITLANNVVTIDNNTVAGGFTYVTSHGTYTSTFAVGIIVVDAVYQKFGTGGTAVLQDRINITNNSVPGSYVTFSPTSSAQAGGSIQLLTLATNGMTSGVVTATESASVTGNDVKVAISVNNIARNEADAGIVNMTNNFSVDNNSAGLIAVSNQALNGSSNNTGFVGGSVSMANTFSIDNNSATLILIQNDAINEASTASVISGTVAMTNTLSMAGNSAALALIFDSASNEAETGTVSQTNVISITSNTFGFIAVTGDVANHAQSGTATQTNVITIADNAAGEGIVVDNSASNFGDAGKVSMANTVTIDRNIVSSGFGVFVVDGAANFGGALTLSSQINIDNNTILHNSEGIFVSLYAASATATQSGQLIGNLVTSNGFGTVSSESAAGVTFFDTVTSGGAAGQTFQLSNNTISYNTTNGIFTSASGAGAVQTFTLVGGNHINHNTGFGLYLVNGGGATVTFHTGVGNDLTGNSSGPLKTVGVVTVTP